MAKQYSRIVAVVKHSVELPNEEGANCISTWNKVSTFPIGASLSDIYAWATFNEVDKITLYPDESSEVEKP